jgi:hypothetical protein
MGIIIKNQEKKIKLYSKLLDINKKNSIIKILKLFYDSFMFVDNTSVVDWLDNQIAFFSNYYSCLHPFQSAINTAYF